MFPSGAACNEGGEEASETVMRRSMPTWDYMLMHPAARLSASETKELVTGLVATFGGYGGEGGEEHNEGDEPNSKGGMDY